MKKKLVVWLLAITMVMAMIPCAFAADEDTPQEEETGSWVSVWSTSMVKGTVEDVIKEKKGSFIASFVALSGNTMRVAITPQGSGDKVRLVLANDFGTSALQIKAITLAKTNANYSDSIVKSTCQSVLYNGQKSFSIPAGERITTDPLTYDVTAGEKLSVSIYYGSTEPNTIGLYGGDSCTNVISADNYTTSTDLQSGFLGIGETDLYSDDSAATGHYDLIPTLCEVDTYGTETEGCCVIFGDSTVTNDTGAYLAEALRNKGVTNLSVTQAAIKGNRLTADGAGSQGDFLGISALKRFQKDVLDQAGVKYVIVKIGVNDIIHPQISGMNAPYASLEQLQEGFRTLNQMAEEAGVEVCFCALSPWKGYTREGSVEWTAEIDALRLEINNWLLHEYHTGARLDARAMADGDALISSYTTDGAHSTTSGQKKLADIFLYYLESVIYQEHEEERHFDKDAGDHIWTNEEYGDVYFTLPEDVDGSFSVSLADVSALFHWWNGKLELTEAQLRLGNVNSDSTTDLNDAAALYQKLAD